MPEPLLYGISPHRKDSYHTPAPFRTATLSHSAHSAVPQLFLYLTLDEHGHVHEHVVELLDRGLQLDNVGVSGLNVRQRLLRGCRVHDNSLKIKPDVCYKEVSD